MNPYIKMLYDMFTRTKEAVDKERAKAEPNEEHISSWISEMSCIRHILFECEYHLDYDHTTNSYSIRKVDDKYAIIHDYEGATI